MRSAHTIGELDQAISEHPTSLCSRKSVWEDALYGEIALVDHILAQNLELRRIERGHSGRSATTDEAVMPSIPAVKNSCAFL